MSFVHLHVYSAYSLLTSTAAVPELINNAWEKGFRTLALTDRNVMYGTIEFYKLCKQKGLKPIIGLTVDVSGAVRENEAFPLVLLAENETGYKNLLKISSAVQTKSENGLPVKWLRHYAAGLIAITPGVEGEIEQAILNGELEQGRELIRKFLDIFGKENFFLALQNHQLEQEAKIRRQLVSLSKELNVPLVATNKSII